MPCLQDKLGGFETETELDAKLQNIREQTKEIISQALKTLQQPNKESA